jgi:hypothetical protein
VILGDFDRMVSAEAEGFSGSQFCFVVEALDNGTGKRSFGAKPVQQEGPMMPEHPGRHRESPIWIPHRKIACKPRV